MAELLSFMLSRGDQFRRQRLPSLYSDFTVQRQSNPDGFTANTSAWIQFLEDAAQAGLLTGVGGERDTLSLTTGTGLLQALETKQWGRPLALGAVIDEALSQRLLIPYEEFRAAQKSIYDRHWTIRPWWLFAWGMRPLRLFESSIGAGALRQGRFIILRNLEEAARKILQHMGGESNQMNRIYPIPVFRSEVAKAIDFNGRLTDDDTQILLTYLGREKSAVTYDNQTVKFKNPGDTSTTLSDQDRTISSLKSVIANLNIQIAQMSARISSLSQSAQCALRSKNRVSALAALRSKKLNESILTQRYQTLSRLEELYDKIEQAADQVTVVRAMQASTAVLRTLCADVGGVDKVEDIVDGLTHEMRNIDELSKALEAGGPGNDVIDESEVDEEFKAMQRQAKLDEAEAGALKTKERLASTGNLDEANVASSPHQPIVANVQDGPLVQSMNALRRLSLNGQELPDVEDISARRNLSGSEPNLASNS